MGLGLLDRYWSLWDQMATGIIVIWVLSKLSLSLFIYLKKYRDDTETHSTVNWALLLWGKLSLAGYRLRLGL